MQTLFTDRFIKVPIKEYNLKNKEITGEEGELFDNWQKIDPDTVVAYRPYLDDDGNKVENKIHLLTEHEPAFPIFWSVAEFEKRMNDFYFNRELKKDAISK